MMSNVQKRTDIGVIWSRVGKPPSPPFPKIACMGILEWSDHV